MRTKSARASQTVSAHTRSNQPSARWKSTTAAVAYFLGPQASRLLEPIRALCADVQARRLRSQARARPNELTSLTETPDNSLPTTTTRKDCWSDRRTPLRQETGPTQPTPTPA